MESFWKHFFLDNGDISLIEAGRQKFSPQQINDYKVKHDLVFHLVLEGKGTYTVGGLTHSLQVGDAFILHRGQQVYYVPDETDPWTTCWIGIGGKNLMTHLAYSQVLYEDVLSFSNNSAVLATFFPYLDFLAKCIPTETSDYLYLFSQLYQLLHLMVKEFPSAHQEGNPYALSESTLAERIYTYLYAHARENITVASIADHFDISRNYLFKLCKTYYGQSPKQIIQELRMYQASQLLRGSQMQVKEIANHVGYRDTFSFSKMFKEYYHYSPSDFRKLSDAKIDAAMFIRDKFLTNKPDDTDITHD